MPNSNGLSGWQCTGYPMGDSSLVFMISEDQGLTHHRGERDDQMVVEVNTCRCKRRTPIDHES